MNKITVSDFILAISDLIEAQSSELQKSWGEFFELQRNKTKKVFLDIALIFIFAVMIILGFLSFCYASFILLSMFVPKYISMYIVSGIFFVIAYIIIKKVNK